MSENWFMVVRNCLAYKGDATEWQGLHFGTIFPGMFTRCNCELWVHFCGTLWNICYFNCCWFELGRTGWAHYMQWADYFQSSNLSLSILWNIKCALVKGFLTVQKPKGWGPKVWEVYKLITSNKQNQQTNSYLNIYILDRCCTNDWGCKHWSF